MCLRPIILLGQESSQVGAGVASGSFRSQMGGLMLVEIL